MNEGRCTSCKHWTREPGEAGHSVSKMGLCEGLTVLSYAQTARVSIEPDPKPFGLPAGANRAKWDREVGLTPTFTTQDFGCVKWQAR